MRGVGGGEGKGGGEGVRNDQSVTATERIPRAYLTHVFTSPLSRSLPLAPSLSLSLSPLSFWGPDENGVDLRAV